MPFYLFIVDFGLSLGWKKLFADMCLELNRKVLHKNQTSLQRFKTKCRAGIWFFLGCCNTHWFQVWKNSESRNYRIRVFKSFFFFSIREPNHWVQAFGKNPKRKGYQIQRITTGWGQGGGVLVKEPKKDPGSFSRQVFDPLKNKWRTAVIDNNRVYLIFRCPRLAVRTGYISIHTCGYRLDTRK